MFEFPHFEYAAFCRNAGTGLSLSALPGTAEQQIILNGKSSPKQILRFF